MERINGEVRNRQKIMRGIKGMDAPILKGTRIYHNYIMPHGGIQWRTLAEAAGIRVEYQDKRKTLIQNASKKATSH
ncbi:MAG: transposase, partial [Nitrososphaerota archaeon]|nr:transposase [Nitrososphaerota archaeon]